MTDPTIEDLRRRVAALEEWARALDRRWSGLPDVMRRLQAQTADAMLEFRELARLLMEGK